MESLEPAEGPSWPDPPIWRLGRADPWKWPTALPRPANSAEPGWPHDQAQPRFEPTVLSRVRHRTRFTPARSNDRKPQCNVGANLDPNLDAIFWMRTKRCRPKSGRELKFTSSGRERHSRIWTRSFFARPKNRNLDQTLDEILDPNLDANLDATLDDVIPPFTATVSIGKDPRRSDRVGGASAKASHSGVPIFKRKQHPS